MKKGIFIPVGNGYYLVAEQNTDPSFSKEIFVGITDGNGVWWQDLAVIRPAYDYGADNNSLKPVWKSDKFEVLVYSDENNEDYTHDFSVGLYHGGI